MRIYQDGTCRYSRHTYATLHDALSSLWPQTNARRKLYENQQKSILQTARGPCVYRALNPEERMEIECRHLREMAERYGAQIERSRRERKCISAACAAGSLSGQSSATYPSPGRTGSGSGGAIGSAPGAAPESSILRR